MGKSEVKYQNTAIKMDKAMLKLLETKDFLDISVSEICREANVNRSTFYDHYLNTSDLLKETQKEIMKDFTLYFNNYSIEFPDFSKNNSEEFLFISPKYLIPYLEYVKKHKKLFKTYLSNLSTFNVDEAYGDLFEYVLKPVFIRMGVDNDLIMNYMSKFYLSGITAIVNEWINRDCQDDMLFVVEIIIACIPQQIS